MINKFKWFEGKCDIAIDKVRKLVMPVKSVCNMTKNILDGNGKILKTACLVTQLRNFDEAQRFCQANNMPSLFAIKNSNERSEILNFASSIFTRFTGTSFLSLNGFNLVTGNNWFYRNPLMTPMFSGIVPRMCSGKVLRA